MLDNSQVHQALHEFALLSLILCCLAAVRILRVNIMPCKQIWLGLDFHSTNLNRRRLSSCAAFRSNSPRKLDQVKKYLLIILYKLRYQILPIVSADRKYMRMKDLAGYVETEVSDTHKSLTSGS